MMKKTLKSLKLLVLFTVLSCYLFFPASPNAFAELVTAYTFEEGTELLDVAVMLGGGGVLNDSLTCVGNNCMLTEGVFGKGMILGLSDYLKTQSDSSDLNPGPNGFTIAFYTYGIDVASSSHIVSKYYPITGWFIGSNKDPARIIGGFLGGVDENTFAVEETVEDMWRHIALTFDGVTAWLYIDGVLKQTRNDVNFIQNDIPLHFAAASHDPEYFGHHYGGIFDDVAIFNEPLSANDIQSLSQNGLEQFMGCITVPVTIDIKPGSDPNCFNINGHGVIPVAILGSADLDVMDIKTDETLSFNGLAVRVRGKKGPLCSIEDSNGDEFLDLVCHFEDDTDEWLTGSNESATLTGELIDGTPIEGSDSICIVP
jgi:hypothetical protein